MAAVVLKLARRRMRLGGMHVRFPDDSAKVPGPDGGFTLTAPESTHPRRQNHAPALDAAPEARPRHTAPQRHTRPRDRSCQRPASAPRAQTALSGRRGSCLGRATAGRGTCPLGTPSGRSRDSQATMSQGGQDAKLFARVRLPLSCTRPASQAAPRPWPPP